MEISEAIKRHGQLMKALRKLGLPEVNFCYWLKALKDFDRPLKRKKITI